LSGVSLGCLADRRQVDGKSDVKRVNRGDDEYDHKPTFECAQSGERAAGKKNGD
jgi:hypothetical protein